MDEYKYPEEICGYCEYTEWGTEPYYEDIYNRCEGRSCEDAAVTYEEETGKKWEW